jgi:hypothetical protein
LTDIRGALEAELRLAWGKLVEVGLLDKF